MEQVHLIYLLEPPKLYLGPDLTSPTVWCRYNKVCVWGGLRVWGVISLQASKMLRKPCFITVHLSI